MSPEPASTVLSAEQMAVAFRQHTLLPLDDCLYALQATIPLLSRSALPRCFQRRGISRLPHWLPARRFCRSADRGRAPVAPKCLMRIFVAIDRTSKVVFAELHPRAKRVVAAEFLRRVLDKLPYKAHTVLTDNGVQFMPQAHQLLLGGHSFDRICRE